MTRSSRSLISILLALLIAVTATHVGAMRGQAKAAGSIVLCTGNGPVGVVVDADGQPVGAVHVCPDCVMSLLAAPDMPAVSAQRIVMARRLPFAAAPVAGASRGTARPRARGPPRLS